MRRSFGGSRRVRQECYILPHEQHRRNLPVSAREAIERAPYDLGRLDTFPHQKLKGVDAYKLRVGNYRVVYDFDRSEGRIDALTVGDRKDIYERFL